MPCPPLTSRFANVRTRRSAPRGRLPLPPRFPPRPADARPFRGRDPPAPPCPAPPRRRLAAAAAAHGGRRRRGRGAVPLAGGSGEHRGGAELPAGAATAAAGAPPGAGAGEETGRDRTGPGSPELPPGGAAGALPGLCLPSARRRLLRGWPALGTRRGWLALGTPPGAAGTGVPLGVAAPGRSSPGARCLSVVPVRRESRDGAQVWAGMGLRRRGSPGGDESPGTGGAAGDGACGNGRWATCLRKGTRAEISY